VIKVYYIIYIIKKMSEEKVVNEEKCEEEQGM